ncbi:hypothetical protein BDR26DRAFT_869714 [Obelidium mucronatum]|nr:hypothetical protein BDR26DRAFT_869714 [Obelidium mucronatum]
MQLLSVLALLAAAKSAFADTFSFQLPSLPGCGTAQPLPPSGIFPSVVLGATAVEKTSIDLQLTNIGQTIYFSDSPCIASILPTSSNFCQLKITPKTGAGACSGDQTLIITSNLGSVNNAQKLVLSLDASSKITSARLDQAWGNGANFKTDLLNAFDAKCVPITDFMFKGHTNVDSMANDFFVEAYDSSGKIPVPAKNSIFAYYSPVDDNINIIFGANILRDASNRIIGTNAYGLPYFDFANAYVGIANPDYKAFTAGKYLSKITVKTKTSTNACEATLYDSGTTPCTTGVSFLRNCFEFDQTFDGEFDVIRRKATVTLTTEFGLSDGGAQPKIRADINPYAKSSKAFDLTLNVYKAATGQYNAQMSSVNADYTASITVPKTDGGNYAIKVCSATNPGNDISLTKIEVKYPSGGEHVIATQDGALASNCATFSVPCAATSFSIVGTWTKAVASTNAAQSITDTYAHTYLINSPSADLEGKPIAPIINRNCWAGVTITQQVFAITFGNFKSFGVVGKTVSLTASPAIGPGTVVLIPVKVISAAFAGTGSTILDMLPNTFKSYIATVVVGENKVTAVKWGDPVPGNGPAAIVTSDTPKEKSISGAADELTDTDAYVAVFLCPTIMVGNKRSVDTTATIVQASYHYKCVDWSKFQQGESSDGLVQVVVPIQVTVYFSFVNAGRRDGEATTQTSTLSTNIKFTVPSSSSGSSGSNVANGASGIDVMAGIVAGAVGLGMVL